MRRRIFLLLGYSNELVLLLISLNVISFRFWDVYCRLYVTKENGRTNRLDSSRCETHSREGNNRFIIYAAKACIVCLAAIETLLTVKSKSPFLFSYRIYSSFPVVWHLASAHLFLAWLNSTFTRYSLNKHLPCVCPHLENEKSPAPSFDTPEFIFTWQLI
jgi:hypothetical protein